MDLESAAAEEWKADAAHAAALLRAAAAVCIASLGLQRRRGGPWEKTNRTADSVAIKFAERPLKWITVNSLDPKFYIKTP